MKNIKQNFGIILLFIVLVAASCSASKNPARVEKMKSVVENKNFIFRPTALLPLPSTGGKVELTTGRYHLTLLNGTLTSDLPFVGQSISQPIDRDEANIRFTTTKFTYDVKSLKNNRWQISIRPQGVQNVYEFILDVYDNGSSTLRVSSNTRQSISFEGFLVENN